ncbi:LysR family transcriptional regulator [Schleiferilactobacillus shenzhenensis]|nr:LysR family transcriptional regulator [Schleiferilactobacillus shenzhenensis]
MFDLLQTFMAVYETRSFSLAARHLYTTQPTVSHHIRKLEAQLNTPLFVRNKRSATVPTAAADLLYVASGKLLAEWAKTKEAVQNVHDDEYVELRIGLSQSVATVLFPQVAAALAQQFPFLHYDVTVLNSQKVLQQLEAQRIDLGFVEQPLVLRGAVRLTLCPDQLVAAGQPTGTWITREEGSGIRFYTAQYLREQGITPRHLMTVNSNTLLRTLIEGGVGQGLLSRRVPLANVPTTPLGAQFRRHFYLFQNTAAAWPHQKQVVAAIQAVAAQLA